MSVDVPTLADLFVQYQNDYLSYVDRTTQYQAQSFFRRTLTALGDLPLSMVTPEVIRTWRTGLSHGHKLSTIRQYMVRLHAAFTAAVDDYGWMAEHPMKRIKKPPKPRGRVRYLSPDERLRLLAACKASRSLLLYPYVQLTLATGGRKDEVRCLKWAEVDLDIGRVFFLETKTENSRALPVRGEALTLLRLLAAKQRKGVPWVFPSPHANRPCVLEAAWQMAVRKSGVTNFHLHDLRHTFASYMAMSGASLAVIKEALGHKNIAQTLVYTHLMPSYIAGEIERMVEKFLPPNDGESPNASC